MCAIFGSNNLSHFVRLYLNNKDRGSFSFGSTVITKDNVYTFKCAETRDMLDMLQPFAHTAHYFLGHLQAPTSADRNICEQTIHPFEYNGYLVAHNGVLTNFNELISEFNFTDHNSQVDSSIIPRLIDHYSKNTDEVTAISKAFSKLNGTFSTWCVNKHTKDVYICRLSSTLFYDSYFFSSVKYGYMTEVPEMSILKLDRENNKMNIVGQFAGNSHFFTL